MAEATTATTAAGKPMDYRLALWVSLTGLC